MRRIIVLALALMGLATMGTSRTAGAADTAAKLPELHAYPGASDRAGPTYRIRMKALGPGEHVLILDPGPPYIVFDLQPSKDGDVVEFSGVAAVGRHGAILKLKNGTATQAYTLVFARLTRSGVVALMTVSALSAGGYLGGQVARGPGPKIASIKATPAAGNPAQVDLEIDGSALATRGAAFYLVPVLPAPAPSRSSRNGARARSSMSARDSRLTCRCRWPLQPSPGGPPRGSRAAPGASRSSIPTASGPPPTSTCRDVGQGGDGHVDSRCKPAGVFRDPARRRSRATQHLVAPADIQASS